MQASEQIARVIDPPFRIGPLSLHHQNVLLRVHQFGSHGFELLQQRRTLAFQFRNLCVPPGNHLQHWQIIAFKRWLFLIRKGAPGFEALGQLLRRRSPQNDLVQRFFDVIDPAMQFRRLRGCCGHLRFQLSPPLDESLVPLTQLVGRFRYHRRHLGHLCRQIRPTAETQRSRIPSVRLILHANQHEVARAELVAQALCRPSDHRDLVLCAQSIGNLELFGQ